MPILRSQTQSNEGGGDGLTAPTSRSLVAKRNPKRNINDDQENATQSIQAPQKKRKTWGKGQHLTKLLKVYKGTQDWHLPIFRSVNALAANPKVVLYPGSSRHVTASLVFPNVTYVDIDTNVKLFFANDRVRMWVEEHKEYSNGTSIGCLCSNFDDSSLNPLVELESADLMISSCAGIVSRPCAKYLKSGGYFLVSDAHFDARETFLHEQQFRLVAAIDENGTVERICHHDLKGHFTTSQGRPLTRAQVEESKVKHKARRSFQLEKETMFYLFQKTG